MSYTSTVKNEISKLDMNEAENISELSAIIHSIGTINDNIKIVCENSSVSRRIFKIIKNLYNMSPKVTVRQGYNFNKSYIYILEINKKVDLIIDDLSLDKEIPREYIYSDEYLIRAYLRGLFLSSASISDPKKSQYHLEFIVNTEEYAKFISNLLNSFNLKSKYLKRENKYMVYIKEAEKISDFLRLMNATNSLFYFEDFRIYRDHKNMTNRLNNCEQANVDKIIETANKQIKEINKIENIGGLDLLDDKTKEAAVYRLKYPDVSLTELSEIITLETGNKITKSGLYHRFNKIKKLAERIK